MPYARPSSARHAITTTPGTGSIASRLLPALVGHPLLFLEKSPGVSVEVIKGEPEVLVTRADTGSSSSSPWRPRIHRVVLVQETPTRFKVVELSDHHLRIAKILGDKGLAGPGFRCRGSHGRGGRHLLSGYRAFRYRWHFPGYSGSHRRCHAAGAHRPFRVRLPLRDVRTAFWDEWPLPQTGIGDGKCDCGN